MTQLTGKPSFGTGSSPGLASGVTTSVSTNNGANGNNFMKQTGAIWEKISNDGNTKYLSISLTTSELESIISKAKDDNKTKIDLVAFLNKKEGVETRPDFRIFESKKRS